MAIEKVNEDINLEIEPSSEAQITVPGMEDNAMMMEDGSAIVNPMPDASGRGAFNANLAEVIPDDELESLSKGLVGDYEADKNARSSWLKTYSDGLDLLGFKYEDRTKPFAGATGVTHPLLAETVTQFQAQAYKDLLPAEGPVRTQIVGEMTPEIEQQSQRVKEFMNYQISYVMEEYDQELDQMLFHLPLAGSAFRKVYYDSVKGRAVSKFVPAEDVVIPYVSTDLESCERVTHVVKMMGNDLRKKQVGGMYRDIDISMQPVTKNDARDKYDELSGSMRRQIRKNLLFWNSIVIWTYRDSRIRIRNQVNQLVLNYPMLLLLMKAREKFYPFTETTRNKIPYERKYNTLYTISFCLALVFMALVLSTCSEVSHELQRPHSVNSLMLVRCPISPQALKLEGCELGMMINPSNLENSGM